MTNPRVCAITATAGRHRCMERSLRFFLDQSYDNCVQLIYQNSPVAQRLNSNVPAEKIILVNQNLDQQTFQPYRTLGAIYRDAFRWVPEDVDIVCFWDDDDIFLPRHIELGVAGMLKFGKTAYKPIKSYFRNAEGIHRVQNTLEPSIFVKRAHVAQWGFSDTTTDQHLQWVRPLGWHDVVTDEEGIPTLCYNWGDSFPTFKTSGDAGNPQNFQNYHRFSTDHGDGILTPISTAEAAEYYKLFE